MEPQTNQPSGAYSTDSPINASTMPLPASPIDMSGQNPPVPAQAPPLMPVSPVLRPTVPVHSVAASQDSDAAPEPSSGVQTASGPADATDTDVIEREWVIAAKKLVAETKSDPYKQVIELNKLKADYMKKRYNKDIKLPEA